MNRGMNKTDMWDDEQSQQKADSKPCVEIPLEAFA